MKVNYNGIIIEWTDEEYAGLLEARKMRQERYDNEEPRYPLRRVFGVNNRKQKDQNK